MNPEPRRILIVKPSSLGDIVHALPFLHALRQRFPNTYLAWLAKREWAPLLVGHPDLNEVRSACFAISDTASLLRAVRGGFDWAIDLQGLFRSGLLTRLSGAKVRIGLSNAREGAGFFYTQKAQVPADPTHAVERYLRVCPLFGVEQPPVVFSFPDFSAARRSLERILESRQVPRGRPRIALHVTSRERPKRWPAEHFARLADQLIRERDAVVLLIGARPERAEVQTVLDRMSECAFNLAGETSLVELAALLSGADLLVCNDSGPMHLAAALGTRVVALFGPTDPVEVGPYGKGHRVLRADWDCSSCSRSQCVQGGACLRALSAGMATEAAKSVLEDR